MGCCWFWRIVHNNASFGGSRPICGILALDVRPNSTVGVLDKKNSATTWQRCHGKLSGWFKACRETLFIWTLQWLNDLHLHSSYSVIINLSLVNPKYLIWLKDLELEWHHILPFLSCCGNEDRMKADIFRPNNHMYFAFSFIPNMNNVSLIMLDFLNSWSYHSDSWKPQVSSIIK